MHTIKWICFGHGEYKLTIVDPKTEHHAEFHVAKGGWITLSGSLAHDIVATDIAPDGIIEGDVIKEFNYERKDLIAYLELYLVGNDTPHLIGETTDIRHIEHWIKQVNKNY